MKSFETLVPVIDSAETRGDVACELKRARNVYLCIGCAVGHSEFRERAPRSANALEEGSEARAWINGRGFRLVRHCGDSRTCTECGEAVSVVYSPEDQEAA